MKKLTKQIALLKRIDQLVRLRATGRPKQFAQRIGVSEATLFRIIEIMKEFNAPVYYDLAKQSYAYSEPTKFKCGFFIEDLDDGFQKNLNGGYGFDNMKELIKF